MTYITEEIIKIDKEITSLSAKYKPLATPINITYIQNKILNETNIKNINQVRTDILGFSYAGKENNQKEIINKLNEIKIPSSIFKKLYKHKVNESCKKLEMMKNIGKTEFSKMSEKLYGSPDKNLIEKAYKILELKESKESNLYNTQKAKKVLQNQLDLIGIDWIVTNKKILSNALISPSKKQVILCSNQTFSENTIKRLAVHEIGTHGVRYLNARLQPLNIFKNFPGYLATEEGLAAFNEELSGFLCNDTLRKYAGRVIAVDFAKDHNLIETFNFLKQYFKEKTALNIALRIKRGLPNSESLGAYTKDHVYLKGFLDIKEFTKKNPLKYLYYGKINLDYIKLLIKIKDELTPIKYHPLLAVEFDKKQELF